MLTTVYVHKTDLYKTDKYILCTSQYILSNQYHYVLILHVAFSRHLAITDNKLRHY